MRRRQTRSPSGLGPLGIEDAMAALAMNEIAAFELLRERGTNSRPARASRVVDHRCHGDVLTLFENAEEIVLQPFGQLRLDPGRALAKLFHFRAKVAEGVLP